MFPTSKVQFTITTVRHNNVEHSYEVKSLPYHSNDLKHFGFDTDEQYIIIDLSKSNKINDDLSLSFEFNPSYPLVEKHYLLGRISNNRLKLLDIDGLVYTIEL
jgi:hypothetical protein